MPKWRGKNNKLATVNKHWNSCEFLGTHQFESFSEIRVFTSVHKLRQSEYLLEAGNLLFFSSFSSFVEQTAIGQSRIWKSLCKLYAVKLHFFFSANHKHVIKANIQWTLNVSCVLTYDSVSIIWKSFETELKMLISHETYDRETTCVFYD